jgi:hypothetical protein
VNLHNRLNTGFDTGFQRHLVTPAVSPPVLLFTTLGTPQAKRYQRRIRRMPCACRLLTTNSIALLSVIIQRCPLRALILRT